MVDLLEKSWRRSIWRNNQDDLEFVKGLIGQYLLEIDQKVDLENAINILSDNEKSELKRRIESFLKNEEKDPDVLASVNITESYGSNVLNTFFKCFLIVLFKIFLHFKYF